MSAGVIRRAIHSDRFPKPVASYSQGFQMGNMLFITGQLPVDPTTNLKVGDGDITLETVFRFKGQSSPAVVFTEIDFEALDDNAMRRIFVGATRASLKLVLVVSERAAAVFLKRLEEPSPTEDQKYQ